jgi:hypothetical protein
MIWIQIAMPNPNLEESSSSAHLFCFIKFIVEVFAQNICLLSDYLTSYQVFGDISPTIKSINKNIISVLKRKRPEKLNFPLCLD